MGNRFEKQKQKSVAEIAPSDYIRNGSPPVATLYGHPASSLTYYLRFALLYKPITLRFAPMETWLFTLELGDDSVSGTAKTVLQYVEDKFPEPPLLRKNFEHDWEATTPLVVRMALLQHKSMRRHVERVVRWGMDLATRGGKAAADPGVGTPRMEVRKFAKSYEQLLEVMLEHAQMEEKIIFPILQLADRGICKSANAEHARDLPIMNGIKEALKSIGALDPGTPAFLEALSNLSARLDILQENCKQHFEEEEEQVFPLMEAAEVTREQQGRVLNQSIEVMRGTHSHLGFFIDGLLPSEAMQYLDLIMHYVNKETAAVMLRALVEYNLN
ncbi:hypothetical protein Nepgr_001326 [Nepenthes gracilis]|uniref:Hemerythrin-like domain-containing protein n=1 Tax=Nepenthes gracilis TaxID=150966 RepID=A0AAD3P522_NEPGR|nr:hypothetical protein Nepgr_001326 [Nepenthes gracilis]